MMYRSREFELAYERGIRLLSQYMPDGSGRKKPIIIHSVRVAERLMRDRYSDNVVLAGLLHDIVEWTESDEKEVRVEFGDKVFAIIKANTQNRSLARGEPQWRDMVDRCSELGEDALIVKAADALDSYNFYTSIRNTDEVQRSVGIARYILEKKGDLEGSIVDELTLITQQ